MGHDHAELGRRLEEAVGAAHVSGDEAFTVRPGAAAEIAEVMRIAGDSQLAVFPMGTASRRRQAGRGPLHIIVDMTRMTHVLHLDETSLVVHAQAGTTGLKLEELLVPRGLTLGDFPPAALTSTLGGLLAVRTPGKSSPRHGFLEDAVLGVSAVLADGRTIHSRVAPRRATGPDLSRMLLGSEGTLGILTGVVLRIHRRAESRLLSTHCLPTVEEAFATIYAALRADCRPAALRVYDAAEAAVHLGKGLVTGEQAILVVATAGPPELAAIERDLVADAALARGAKSLGTGPAETWWRRRMGHTVSGPLPPTPMLEVTASPRRLGPVYRAILGAAESAKRQARAHISRFDADGACLFFTLLEGARLDARARTRSAVEKAARAAGGHLLHERDPELVPYLNALRQELDPHGILNPGILT